MTATELPGFPDGNSEARGINEAGQVVGTRTTADGLAVATVWTDAEAAALPPLVDGGSAHAVGINARGEIAGTASTAVPGEQHAVRWRDGQVIDLGLPKGMVQTWAVGISHTGDLIGQAWKPGGSRAVIWKGSKAKLLPIPPHTASSWVEGINRHGEMVGSLDSGNPVYWASADAMPVSINELTAAAPCISPEGHPIELWSVAAINDNGVIVGAATWTPQGGRPLQAAFRLTPNVLADLQR